MLNRVLECSSRLVRLCSRRGRWRYRRGRLVEVRWGIEDDERGSLGDQFRSVTLLPSHEIHVTHSGLAQNASREPFVDHDSHDRRQHQMESASHRLKEESSKRDAIAKKIAALQAQLEKLPDPTPNLPRPTSPKRKRDEPKILAPETPSPSKYHAV